MKKKLVALLLLALTATANDCVPLTFTTLSSMVGEKHSYPEWKSATMPDGKSPTTMDAVRAWNDKQKFSRLYCIYSVLPDVSFKDEGINHDTPYLWIGIPRKDMVAPDESPGAHAAVVIFTVDKIAIIHTIDAKNRVEERVTVEELMNRTLCLFKVDHLVEFIHFETTGEVIIIDRRN